MNTAMNTVPVKVNRRRGDVVESSHEVDICVADRTGALLHCWGDPDRPVIARSAIKSLQALPLITTGAAARFGVTDDELALACASHSAEPEHVRQVTAWLDRLGLDSSHLECGPDVPLGAAAVRTFWADGQSPNQIANCCSGKHAGFLTVAMHLGEPTAGYIQPDHVVQQQVAEAVRVMTSVDSDPCGVDGCGIPVHALPLQSLAMGMARLVDPVDVPEPWRSAAQRMASALTERAFLVSGLDRFEVKLQDAANEPVISKTGAEGVFMGALPDRGLGFALKARDGARAASEAALSALMVALEVVESPVVEPLVHNKAGTVSGSVLAELD